MNEYPVTNEQEAVNQPIGLHKKILKVMQKVSYLEKDIGISFKSTRYKAISETKVTSIVRKALLECDLTFVPVSQRISRREKDNVTVAEVTYQLTDAETNESIQVVSVGEGADNQDKGAGKALTYAYKYALLRTFAIATGEDPDAISSDELTDKNNNQKNNIINDISVSYNGIIQTGVNPQYLNSYMFNVLGKQFNHFSELNLSELSTIKIQLIQYTNKPMQF